MKSQNPLLQAPVPKLIQRIGIPVTIGVLFNNLFQVVDTFYAGTISKEALAALALSFPVYFIIIGLGSGLGTGASALIGNALGADKRDEACHIAGQGLMMTIILGIILSIVGTLVSPALFRLLGASDDILQMNLEYIIPIFLGSVAFNLVQMFNAMLSSQGNTRPFGIFLVLGFILNLVLDPWFIHGGFGLPAMGIMGVAIATVAIQMIGVVYLGTLAFRSDLMKTFKWQLMKPDQRKVYEILQQGLPSAIDLSTVSVGNFIIMYFVNQFGTDAVAGYGIAFRLDGLIWIPLVGLEVATITLVSQNNGAQLIDRMWKACNTSLQYGLMMMAVSGVIVFILAEPLVGIFTDDPNIIAIGIVYIRISALGLWAKPLSFVGLAALRGIKRPVLPMIISINRMIILPTLAAYIVVTMLNGQIENIWWSILFINIAAGLVAWTAVIKYMPRLKAELKPAN